MKTTPRPRHPIRSIVLSVISLTAGSVAFAADTTVSGNLLVEGTVDVDGNTLTLGTQSGTHGLSLSYADANVDTLTFYLNRNPGSWLWAHNSAIPAMRLAANHELMLYRSDGTTVGVSFTPETNTLSLGATTLYRDSSTGALRTNGALTVDGAASVSGTFTAPSFAASSGTLTGGASGLTLNAGSSDQNITLALSGTGFVTTNSKIVVSSNGSAIGNNSTSVAAGNVGLSVGAETADDLGGRAVGLWVQGIKSDNGDPSPGYDGTLGLHAVAATTAGSTANIDRSFAFGGGLLNRINVRHDGSGVITGATGFFANINNGTSTSGAIVDAAAFMAGRTSIGTGKNITRYYAFYGSVPVSLGGTMGTYYGLYLENPTLATSNWSIYSAGGTSFHAGQLRLGSSTNHSGEQLQVAGTAYVSGNANVGGMLTAASGRFDGPVRIAQQGDLLMGDFTSEP